jgi:hypothetical protein
MKRLMFLVLGCLFFLSIQMAYAITWHEVNQATVGWTAVTTLSDGSPLPADSTIQYRVFTRSVAGEIAELGVTSLTTYTVTLSDGQKVLIGVQAERVKAGTVVSKSARVSWSDNSADCLNGEDFGVAYTREPANVTGLYPKK